MDKVLTQDLYLDQEVESVRPFEGPTIRFSRIDAVDDGLRPYQAEMKHSVYAFWDKMNNVMLQMPTGTGKTIVFTSESRIFGDGVSKIVLIQKY